LLHVGDLREVKDQRTLIAAVHRLHADGRDVDLDIAGEDTQGGALQSSSIASALGDKLRMHGRLPRAALRSLMERADLLVMSSRHEAGPVAVLEAAIAGVPTVGTAVGHIADWAPDAALAVPVGDDAALADAIGALLDDEPHRFAMAREAQRRAIAADADATASSYVQVYEALRAR
jgi:glycosyltransferase involved in cell wall biosynthesis